MRDLILKMSISIDGFVGGADGAIKWVFDSDKEATASTVATVSSASLHIMGSRTFHDMAAYWGTSAHRYNRLPETAEAAGERLVAELAVPREGSSSTTEWLRSVPVAKLLNVWGRHRDIQLGAIVDGWIIPEQPAKRFSEGKAIAIPFLVGSNADEATVFGHGGPASIENFREYIIADTGPFAAQEYAIYRPTSEADVPIRYLQLQNDSFAYGALSMARTVAAHGQKSYLYLFTYAENGKRSALGAYHGEELYFLSSTFPVDWQVDETDAALGKAIRTYWVQFARTGNPNSVGVPEWPAYSTEADDSMSLGRTIHRAPVGVQVNALRHVMKQVLITAGAIGPTNHPE